MSRKKPFTYTRMVAAAVPVSSLSGLVGAGWCPIKRLLHLLLPLLVLTATDDSQLLQRPVGLCPPTCSPFCRPRGREQPVFLLWPGIESGFQPLGQDGKVLTVLLILLWPLSWTGRPRKLSSREDGGGCEAQLAPHPVQNPLGASLHSQRPPSLVTVLQESSAMCESDSGDLE